MKHAKNLEGADMIILTRAEYDILAASAEDALDGVLIDEAKVADAGAPTLPSEILVEVLSGNLHPLAAWRKAAGLTQGQLADRANTRAATISDIEGNRLDPRLSTLCAISGALGVNLDDIIVG